MTKVSIIVPCRDDGQYLEETLRSAAAQTHPDVEVIIVDDHSEDPATLAVFEKLQAQGIRVLPSVGHGPAAARNTGIANAVGEYILPLDADDLIEPDYTARAAAILDTSPRVGICFCDVRLFGLRNSMWRFRGPELGPILLGDTIITSASMFRRSDWKAVGGFDENLVHGFEDFSFWLSLIETGCEVHHIPEPLLHYRIKPRSRSAKLFIDKREQDVAMDVFRLHRKLFESNSEFLFVAYRQLHEERAQRESLLSWRLGAPILHLEWSLRQVVKKLLGRA